MSSQTESYDRDGRSRGVARRGGKKLFRPPATAIAFVALSAPLIGSSRAAEAAPAGTAHYPDLQSTIPLTGLFIENPTPTTRLLSYTHIIPNLGDGQFEIRPLYDPKTDTARGFQRLYTHDSAGNWSILSETPIVGTFFYHAAHGHYHFPLADYGLFNVAPDGSLGAEVAPSTKLGFCIADDLVMNSALPHFSSVFGYSGGSCPDPTALRGISVGWGDLYDRTDAGQSIDITNLPDGTYWFRTSVDPFDYLLEKDKSNNITDLKIRIAGNTVAVLAGPFFPDSTPPQVALVAPAGGASLSGSVLLTATATDPSGIARLQFLADGSAIGNPIVGGPYTISWDTTAVPDGVHYLSAQVTAGSGRIGTASAVTVTVANQAPTPVDQTISVDGSGPVTTPAFSVAAGQLLLAFVASDGPSSGGQGSTVSSAGLSWTLLKRTNAQLGSAEIWTATSTSPLVNTAVTSTQTVGSYAQSLTVVSFANAGGAGATGGANAPSGAPSVSLVTTQAGSLIYGVGNDWDNALARVVPTGQVMVHQKIDTVLANTAWVQTTATPIPAAGTPIVLNDTQPTIDRWNFSAVEIRPPSGILLISGVLAANRTTSSATIQWTTNVPASSRVDYGVDANYGGVASDSALVASHSVPLTGLSPGTTYHYKITSQDALGNLATTGDFIFTTAGLSVISCTISSPVSGATVSGAVAVSANASSTASITGIQFKLDGGNLGAEVTTLPYAISWDTTSATNGSHVLTATARDPTGNVAVSAPVSVVVSNTPPPVVTVDQTVSIEGTGAVTTPGLSATAGRLLVAFVASDGPFSGGQAATVSGAGLSWTLVKRTNDQAGTAEVWMATATGPLTSAAVTSTQLVGGYNQSLTVASFVNAGGVGAFAGASAPGGAPSVSLVTTRAGSLIYGVGNDWDNAIARVLGPGQVMIHQSVDTTLANTYWVQAASAPSPTSGTTVGLNDTQPTTDRWNFAAIEIVPATR